MVLPWPWGLLRCRGRLSHGPALEQETVIKPSAYQGKDRCVFVALWPRRGQAATPGALLAGVTGMRWLPPRPLQAGRILGTSKSLRCLESFCFFPPFPIPGHFPAELQPRPLSPLLDIPASRDLAQRRNFCYPSGENLRSLRFGFADRRELAHLGAQRCLLQPGWLGGDEDDEERQYFSPASRRPLPWLMELSGKALASADLHPAQH